MSQSRWMTRGTLGSMGMTAVVILIAGCGSSGTPAPAGSSGPASSTSTSASAAGTATSTAPTSPQPDPEDPVAQKLCDEIKPQLSDWRVQGPSLGGTALNIAVHEWALRNGGLQLSARVLGDKAMIDRITTKTCPDVRTEALQALNLPNFAAGILF